MNSILVMNSLNKIVELIKESNKTEYLFKVPSDSFGDKVIKTVSSMGYLGEKILLQDKTLGIHITKKEEVSNHLVPADYKIIKNKKEEKETDFKNTFFSSEVSSSIAGIVWFSNILGVAFRSNEKKFYFFKDVPCSTYEEFVSQAEKGNSLGRFYHKEVKNKFGLVTEEYVKENRDIFENLGVVELGLGGLDWPNLEAA